MPRAVVSGINRCFRASDVTWERSQLHSEKVIGKSSHHYASGAGQVELPGEVFVRGKVEETELPDHFRLLNSFQEEKGNSDEIAAVSICTALKATETHGVSAGSWECCSEPGSCRLWPCPGA